MWVDGFFGFFAIGERRASGVGWGRSVVVYIRYGRRVTAIPTSTPTAAQQKFFMAISHLTETIVEDDS